MQKINPTSIFSKTFRKKFNANKYTSYTSQEACLQSAYIASRGKVYRTVRFGCNALLCGTIFYLFEKGSLMHVINSQFRTGSSITSSKLPREEAKYYNWEQHSFHALEQMKNDYGLVEDHH